MAFTCTLRFFGSLNDFLIAGRKEEWITYSLKTPSSVKDTIEAIGVPHVEVMKILVNGEERPIHEIVQPADQIKVFPFPDHFPATAPKSFVLDVHLGKLARLLRMLGVDSFYQNNLTDKQIVAIAVEQKRAVLTRDVGLLKHKVLAHGYWLRSQQPEKQLAEVITWFSLCSFIQPFSRCIACNGTLHVVPKEEVLSLLPPQTKEYFHLFYQCDVCGKVYWKGSHYENMQRLVEKVRSIAC